MYSTINLIIKVSLKFLLLKLNHCSTMTTKFCPLHVHCYLFTLQQSSVHVCGRCRVENLKTCEQGIFHRVRTCENPCEMGVCLAAACMLPYPPPPPQQKNTMLKSDFCPCACKWTTLIHLLSEGKGHRRIGVLWEGKYKTYFVQDSIATYASLKIIAKGIFSWKAWLNETINLQLSYETRQNN